MFPFTRLTLDPDSVVFVSRASYYNYADNNIIVKKSEDPDNQKLFLLSKICSKDFFEKMPKTFTITTKNSTLHFNIQMLEETSPVISKFIQEHPYENNYFINITDDENILAKIEKLYQGKNIVFKENEIPLIQRFTQLFQIKNFPNYLKPNNLYTDEIDSDGNKLHRTLLLGDNKDLAPGVEIYQKWFSAFLNKDKYKVFKIITKKAEYDCNILGVYLSDVLRQILENDPTATEFQYEYDDTENEFQLISDFFNCKQVDITSINMNSLKEIAEDLQINCILKSVDNYIDNYENFNQKIENQEEIIDIIDNLFDLLYNIKTYGVEKVKVSILQSKWSKKERYVQELAAFILQVIKPSFSLQKEMAELLIQLNKEANDGNQLHVLVPFIIEKLMTLYWPKNSKENPELEIINLTNRCVYSFIRILYKKGIIPKEVIEERLKNYDLSNNRINVFFLPEIIRINPKNIQLIENLIRKHNLSPQCYRYSDNFPYYSRNGLKADCEMLDHWPRFVKKYLPNKIDLYERILDNLQIEDDEILNALMKDDVDKLQNIIIKGGVEANQIKVLYNIFDDFEEEQSLINYTALYGSVKCFKYLILNDCEVDEDTFYFSICGCNNEIIKIIEQKLNSKTYQINDDRNSFYLNLSKDQVHLSFWFNFNDYTNAKFRNIFSHNFHNNHKNNKFDDDSIQYQRYSKEDETINFINCANINNIIAPTIANHQNKLFDWVFENKFINKGKTGNSLKHIAILSALCGNAHSLVAIIDNGFFVTKKIISFSARNGFYKLTQMLLDLYDKKSSEKVDSNDSFDFVSIVHFGNLSIFKLFMKYMNQSDLENALLHSIEINCNVIINYIFDNLDKFNFSIDNNSFLSSALKTSIGFFDLFVSLISKFKKLNPDLFNLDLYSELLDKACLDSSLNATSFITDLILAENPKFDFTKAFFNASSSKSMNICKYFIDKKVFINFNNNSYISKLGSIDVELFESIINSVDQNIRFIFYDCIYSAITNKNLKLIDFIFKEKPPNDLELIEAARTDDIEVVELILKYNSSAIFINRRYHEGTALCIAAKHKNINIVKRLLSLPGIEADLHNEHNQNPLLIAVDNTDLEVIDLLLDYYKKTRIESHIPSIISSLAFIQYKNTNENKPISKKEWDIVLRFLRIDSIDPNYMQSNEFFPNLLSFLYIASFDNKIDVVEQLLRLEKINPNTYDSSSFNTPLMIALEKKYIEIAKLIIQHPKTDINLKNNDNETALTIAVKKEEKEIVDILVNDERFNPHESLLNCAFIYSNNEICEQLYSLSFLDVNEPYKITYRSYKSNNINALYYSVKYNDIDKFDKIIKHHSFNIYKSDISKAIFLSAENNNLLLFRKLIKLINNDINIKNRKTNESLLSYSCKHLSGDIVDEILNNENFDPKNEDFLNAFSNAYSNSISLENNQNLQGNHHRGLRNRLNNLQARAIWEMDRQVLNRDLLTDKVSILEMMEKMINFDKEHENLIKFDQLLPNGKSFFTAFISGYSDIENISDFLIEQGVDVNMADKNGVYPLEHAIKIKSLDLVTSLVNSNKIVFSQLKNGCTYLHLAAQMKDSAILSFLLQRNVIDINSVNILGDTPLIDACKCGSIDIINVLFQHDELDYLHRNKYGKSAIDVYIDLSEDEKESINQSRENFYNLLISIINESNKKD